MVGAQEVVPAGGTQCQGTPRSHHVRTRGPGLMSSSVQPLCLSWLVPVCPCSTLGSLGIGFSTCLCENVSRVKGAAEGGGGGILF